MQNQLLLLEDVESLGRCGDIVIVKPGYARNFLIPQAKAIVADKRALRMKAQLVEKREKQAEMDRTESEDLVARIANLTLSVVTKVDPEGKLYGSVTIADILNLLAQENVILEKKNIVLAHPIKEMGVHAIQLKLKEGVTTSFILTVNSDQPGLLPVAADKAPEETEQ
ncbi:MAG: 50S ribosomal protein L9 [Chlamydiota bacterium]